MKKESKEISSPVELMALASAIVVSNEYDIDCEDMRHRLDLGLSWLREKIGSMIYWIDVKSVHVLDGDIVVEFRFQDCDATSSFCTLRNSALGDNEFGLKESKSKLTFVCEEELIAAYLTALTNK